MEIFMKAQPRDIWDVVTTMDGEVDRAWLIQNPRGFGCTDPGCPDQDGVYLEIMKQGANWPAEFPAKAVADRERGIWLTAVTDHEQSATIVMLEPDAARQLVNSLQEAIAILDRRES